MHVEKKFHSEWTHCQKPFNNHYITIYSSIRKSSCVPFNNMCLIWARGASNVAWNMWCCESGTSFSSNLTLPCGNCTHQWEYMIPCSLLHNWLCNSLLTSFGEDHLETKLSLVFSPWSSCMVSAGVGIVVKGCQLCLSNHALIPKVLLLGEVFCLDAVIHLQRSSETAECQLLDVFK